MGTVFRAWDRATGMTVALKVLHSNAARDRFWREAELLASLVHPHIVRYVGHGVTRDGDPWLAMEWIDGENLGSRLEGGPLRVEETLHLARSLADALAYAHARSCIHRDLKPFNLLLPRGDIGAVKIVDFGLARDAGDELGDITSTGVFMGSVDYMPPEQALDAKRADARADVFSLGAVLYHCLTGRPPYQGHSPSQTLDALLTGTFLSVTALRADAPSGLATLIGRMLSKDRQLRPADGAAVASALGAMVIEPDEDDPTQISVDLEATQTRVVSSSWPHGPPPSAPPSMQTSGPRPSMPDPVGSNKGGTLVMNPNPRPAPGPPTGALAPVERPASEAQLSMRAIVLGAAFLVAVLIGLGLWSLLH